MNPNIQHLFDIANKPYRTILGLMSGTSLDGLDLALCKIIGSGINSSIEVLHFKTFEYNQEIKNEIKKVFCKEDVSLQNICFLNAYLGSYHSQIINQTLKHWDVKNENVDMIASHGQTIYHLPKTQYQQSIHSSTLQIGDADHIAFNTNIITISDFRQKHIAAGGQGAPLAIYGDYFLLSSKNENRVLLNIGGIANFTFLPKSLDVSEIICTDTGAGNTLMDAYIQHHFTNKFYDDDAAIALQGKINNNLLNTLLQHPFFKQPFPKSTGQETFNLHFVETALSASNTAHIDITDILATLNYFTAATIANAIDTTISHKEFAIYVSGGGANNPLLIHNLQTLLPFCNIQSTEKLGLNPNAKEAALFAVLANETLCGSGYSNQKNTTNFLPITMGKISFPN